MNQLNELVTALNDLSIDCFLITDFKGRDSLARRIVGLENHQVFSRRWYFLVHRSGSVAIITHYIEPDVISASSSPEFPISRFYYSSRNELEKSLASALHSAQTVALCYSPKDEIPIVSTVDAGTVELVRSVGVTVVSAAELLQRSFAKLNFNAYQGHIEAGRKVDLIKTQSFDHIAKNAGSLSEYDAVNYILRRFDEEGLTSDHPPCVAVNANSGLPHYQPTKDSAKTIKQGDFVLIDLWAKLKAPHSIYYDITWVGVLRESPTSDEKRVFTVVKAARDGAVELIKNRVKNGEAVFGYEADNAARKIISDAGYGGNFLHRTGHSINSSVHGEGANLDNFETHDNRQLIPWSCFSVEPGIYLKNFGIRSELNMFVLDDSAEVTGQVQQEILCLS